MSDLLWVQETYENDTEGHVVGESDVYEAWTGDVGKLYRTMAREYGRCTGKVYVDQKDGPPIAVGWTFVKRDKYEDSTETYLRRVWVTLHDAAETRTVEYHYHAMAS